VSVEITIWAVFDFLHFVFADLDQRLRDGGQLGGRRVEDDAVVKDPLRSSQEGLRRAVPLLLDVLFHRTLKMFLYILFMISICFEKEDQLLKSKPKEVQLQKNVNK
jgi:hypothetical protein